MRELLEALLGLLRQLLPQEWVFWATMVAALLAGLGLHLAWHARGSETAEFWAAAAIALALVSLEVALTIRHLKREIRALPGLTVRELDARDELTAAQDRAREERAG